MWKMASSTLHVAFDGRCLAAWWDGKQPTYVKSGKKVNLVIGVPSYYLDHVLGSLRSVIADLISAKILPDNGFHVNHIDPSLAGKGLELAVKSNKNKPLRKKNDPKCGLFGDEFVGKIDRDGVEIK